MSSVCTFTYSLSVVRSLEMFRLSNARLVVTLLVTVISMFVCAEL